MSDRTYPAYQPEPLPEGEPEAIAEMVSLVRHFLEADPQGRFRRG